MDDQPKLVARLHAQVRVQMREKARHAHAHGAGRDDHNMNPGAAAIAHWKAEWDHCEAVRVDELQAEVA